MMWTGLSATVLHRRRNKNESSGSGRAGKSPTSALKKNAWHYSHSCLWTCALIPCDGQSGSLLTYSPLTNSSKRKKDSELLLAEPPVTPKNGNQVALLF